MYIKEIADKLRRWLWLLRAALFHNWKRETREREERREREEVSGIRCLSIYLVICKFCEDLFCWERGWGGEKIIRV